jgi:Dolichyl-phosphate-mannose-protein mannosyltransferase
VNRRLNQTSATKWTSTNAFLLYLAFAKLLFHLLTAGRYGIFRDELYYLACSEHLDWGYVDQPPLIAVVAWIARHVFGSSLFGLRLLPAIAGAALVWLTGRLALEMGGRRLATLVAALAAFTAPIYLVFHHWLTMNAFEPLIWMVAVWCVVRAINSGRAVYWFWFGVIAGVGLETKYSLIFFAFGIVAGLILTTERRVLKSKWIWLGAIAAFLIFLPNLIWLVKHNFPFLELMGNIRRSGRDVARGPIAFTLDQAMIMGPILAPLWVGGLVWLFFGKDGRRYRIFGWAYLVMLITFIVLKGKNYYLAPMYPILFAAGAVGFERLTTKRADTGTANTGTAGVPPAMSAKRGPAVRYPWLRWSYITLIIIASIIFAPLSSPLLSPDAYIRYQQTLGIEPSKTEHQDTGPLPQHFADEFGWEDMTREVAKVYYSLPPGERARTAIFANSYGQAGAIDFFGPAYGLPKAISNHQNYWLWGPREYDGSTVIVLGSDGEGDREHFKSVDEAGRTYHPYSRRDEHFPILVCRGLNPDLHTLWPSIKSWD